MLPKHRDSMFYVAREPFKHQENKGLLYFPDSWAEDRLRDATAFQIGKLPEGHLVHR